MLLAEQLILQTFLSPSDYSFQIRYLQVPFIPSIRRISTSWIVNVYLKCTVQYITILIRSFQMSVANIPLLYKLINFIKAYMYVTSPHMSYI